MGGAIAVARRELAGYFATPVAYVFIVIFLMMAGALTFTLGGFFARGQADLGPFFTFVPWLFLFLVPALTMRLWAEERRLGTIELLLTLPLKPPQGRHSSDERSHRDCGAVRCGHDRGGRIASRFACLQPRRPRSFGFFAVRFSDGARHQAGHGANGHGPSRVV